MDTHHTVMREEFSFVNARMYGPTRDSATIWAALAAIGADPCVLVLMEEDDGLWTVDTDVTIPATVTLSVPAGVTVTGAGTLTILGGLSALRLDWYQGTGTLTWSGSAAPHLVARLHAGALTLGEPTTARLTVRSSGTTPWTLTLPPGPGTTQQVLTTDGQGVTSWGTVQAADATLAALAGLATGPDTAPYFTATDQAALMTVTPLARLLLDDATVPDMQATLQVQPLDATLTGLASLATGANLLPYLTGPDQWATTGFSPYARTLLDDVDAPAMRGTLQLGALSTIGTVTTPYLADGAVTYAKLQPVTDARLLGRAAGSAGQVQELTVGAGLQLSGGQLSMVGGFVSGAGAADRLTLWTGAGSLSYDDQFRYSPTLHGLSLGGHAVTGILDVQGAVQASDLANNYMGLRLWPVAPTANALVTGLTVQPITGAHIATASIAGLMVRDQPGAAYAYALYSEIGAGTNRWSIQAAGTAPSYFAGNMGIGAPPGTPKLNIVSPGNSWALSITPGDVGIVIENQPNVGNITNAWGILVRDNTATRSGGYYAIRADTIAGAGKYAFYSAGNASNFLAGNLGIKTEPTYELQVFGMFYMQGGIGIGEVPQVGWGLRNTYQSTFGGIVEITSNRGDRDDMVLYPGSAYIYRLGVGVNTWNKGAGQLWVSGQAYKPAGGPFADSSDVALKTDIGEIDAPLDTLLALHGVRYRWREPAKHGNLTGRYLGMIAQEVEPIMPEWVTLDTDGTKLLGIHGFEALTVEAVRQIKTQLDAAVSRLAALEAAA